MNRRLQTILDIEHISASQLADMLGIQRGGVSHLLSGRNKPSFDFLERILRKFPEISAEWLITGKGKPIRNEKDHSTENISTINTDKNVEQIGFQDYNLFNMPTEPLSQVSNPAAQTNECTSPPRDCDKKPIRVIIYFSDGTYSEFYPFSVPSPSVK